MADGVDTAMEAVQAPGLRATGDGIARIAKSFELPRCDHTMLLRCEFGQRLVRSLFAVHTLTRSERGSILPSGPKTTIGRSLFVALSPAKSERSGGTRGVTRG